MTPTDLFRAAETGTLHVSCAVCAGSDGVLSVDPYTHRFVHRHGCDNGLTTGRILTL